MAALIPIENDPFAASGGNFVPVDHDPFQSQAPFTDALKDIGSNTLESLKGTATQTGEAMSEPMNNPAVSDWSQHPIMGPADAAARAFGKIGNAIGGAYGAATSPVTGALSASVENSGIIPAAASAIKNNLVPNDPRFSAYISPEQQHQIALQGGSDLANAVMMGKAGEQGAANVAKAAGKPPAPSPYDPLADVWAQLKSQSDYTGPRQSFLKSQSSDPNAVPSYSPEEIKAGAVKYYDSSEAKGGMLNPEGVSKAITDANQNAGFQSEEGKAFAGDNIVSKTLNDLNSLQGKPLSLKGAGEIDDELGDRVSAAFRSGNDDQAVRLMKIRDSLRSAYTNASETDMVNPNGFEDWRTGDKLWSAYRAGDDVQKIIENGEKADVPSTAIKNGFKAFVKNDKNLAGFTDDEIAALKHASKTGLVTAALKTMGSKIISGFAGGAGGAVGGGFPGAMVGAVAGEAAGYPMRVAATALQRAKGNAVTEMIGNRPEVQEALRNGPTPKPPVTPEPPTLPAAPMLALPAPKTVIYGNTAGQNIPLSEAGRESIGQSPSTVSEKTPAEVAQSTDAAANSQSELLRKYGTKRLLGSENSAPVANAPTHPTAAGTAAYYYPKNNSGSVPIPAAIAGGAAGAAAQLFNKPTSGTIGQQNQDELKKLQFPQQPQQKPQSSLPDVSNFAKAESNNNPNAKNPNSTASGLYQFTNRTWNDMVARYGKQTGIGFGDKGDPKAQATMAALYAQDNIKSLQQTLGRMPTKGELYEAHVLGAHGAARLIKANPNQEAVMLFPKQVFDANRPIFFDGRRPRTVAEVQQLLSSKVA